MSPWECSLFSSLLTAGDVVSLNVPSGEEGRETAAFAGYYFVYPHTISVIRYKFQRAPIEGGRPPGRQESPSQAHIGVLNRPHHGFGRGNPSDNSCCFLQLIGFPDLKACQFCAYTTRGSAFSYDKRCGLGERIHWFQKYLGWYGQGPRVRLIGHSGIIRISRNQRQICYTGCEILN